MTISDEERDELWRLAQTLDAIPETLSQPQETTDEGQRPGDLYDSAPDAQERVLELLLEKGWTEVYRQGQAVYLRRPGKDVGVSATLGYVAPGVLYVFTTSTEFDAGRAYSPFGAYATLEHGGDFSAAARTLAGIGKSGPRSESPGAAESGSPDDVRELPPPSEPMPVARCLVAERFADSDGNPLLRHWRGEFWQWQTSHWIDVEANDLKAIAYRFTEHAVYAKMTRNGPELVPWAPTRNKIANLVDALGAVTHLSETIDMPTWLDGQGHLPAAEFVSCANGLLHVPTRSLMPHDLAYFNRVAVPFDFDPHPPAPVRWLAFLDELWHDDPDAVAALAEFMGYVISGRLDQHKILLLVGPTRAGKGVIARVLKALVGRGNYAGPTLASLGTNFGLSPLIGKPLAIVSDARLGGANVHQVVERLLSVSGEDMLTIDRKYKEPWTGTLPTRFVVISNELPCFGDASGAIANRFVVLTLHESWLGRENTNLTNELLTELPGILGWVLDGLERLNANGRFSEPASSRDAIVALADLVSPTSAFVRDRCVVGPTYEVSIDSLYAAWKVWADDNGHRPGSVQTFGRNVRAVLPGLRTKRPRDGDDRPRWFEGVGLRSTLNAPDRGPLRTEPEAALHREPDGRVVRDGPRPDLMWSADDDDYPSSAWDTEGDGQSGTQTRRTDGGGSDPTPFWTVNCEHYSEHQSWHRRLGGRWVCDACEEAQASPAGSTRRTPVALGGPRRPSARGCAEPDAIPQVARRQVAGTCRDCGCCPATPGPPGGSVRGRGLDPLRNPIGGARGGERYVP